MHFEFLIEDQSGAKAMEILCPKIIGSSEHTHRIHSYRGGGRDIPSKGSGVSPNKRIFFNRLPSLLKGFGKTYPEQVNGQACYIIVICDLDNENEFDFMIKLNSILDACPYKPVVRFCLSIEEFEAWYLGDLDAVRAAYPRAKATILRRYVNDSICGTWELLADAVFSGGSSALKRQGWQRVGEEKSKWAENIAQNMDIDVNKSPSFRGMVRGVRELFCATCPKIQTSHTIPISKLTE
jgi:hypothetical protein